MKPVIIIAIAFVLLIPLPVFAEIPPSAELIEEVNEIRVISLFLNDTTFYGPEEFSGIMYLLELDDVNYN